MYIHVYIYMLVREAGESGTSVPGDVTTAKRCWHFRDIPSHEQQEPSNFQHELLQSSSLLVIRLSSLVKIWKVLFVLVTSLKTKMKVALAGEGHLWWCYNKRMSPWWMSCRVNEVKWWMDWWWMDWWWMDWWWMNWWWMNWWRMNWDGGEWIVGLPRHERRKDEKEYN